MKPHLPPPLFLFLTTTAFGLTATIADSDDFREKAAGATPGEATTLLLSENLDASGSADLTIRGDLTVTAPSGATPSLRTDTGCGSIILSSGRIVTMTGLGDIRFGGVTTASKKGGTTAAQAQTYWPSTGGLFIGEGAGLRLSGNSGSVSNSDNSFSTGVVSSSSGAGGAAFFVAQRGTLEFLNNEGGVTVDNNSVTLNATGTDAYGAGIYAYSYAEVSFSGNASVSLCGNGLSSSLRSASGAALYAHQSAVVTIGNNVGTVDISRNTATTTADNQQVYGGAFGMAGGSKLYITDNAAVSFTDNRAISSGAGANAYAGALRIDNILSVTGNGSVLFENNRAQGTTAQVQGGAIRNGGSGSINISGNGSVRFLGNSALTADATKTTQNRMGGAIYSGADVTLADNGELLFSGNSVRSGATAVNNWNALGGAIYASKNLTISGNDSVVFEKNYEQRGSSIILRGLYHRNVTAATQLQLSAKEGGSIIFRESMQADLSHALSRVVFNGSYDTANGTYTRTGSGDIIFSGAATANDLNTLRQERDMGAASAKDIAASLCSGITAEAALLGGSLRVEDGASLAFSKNLSVYGEATLALSRGAELSAAGITLHPNTTLCLAGASNILTADSFSMGSGSLVSLTLDAGQLEEAALTLLNIDVSGGLLGGITLELNGLQDVGSGSYRLFTIYGTEDITDYDTSVFSLRGEGVEASAFRWDADQQTLFYDYTAPVTDIIADSSTDNLIIDAPARGNIIVRDDRTATLNSTLQGGDIIIEHGTAAIGAEAALSGKVIFAGNTAEAARTLELTNGSTLTAIELQAANGNTICVRDGSAAVTNICGSGTMDKTGSGTLLLNGNNSHTGGTTVSAGTLAAGSDTAFGTGTVTINGGTLDLGGYKVSNAVSALNGTLDGASHFSGQLTVDGDVTLGGTTTATQVTLLSGTLRGGSITGAAIILENGKLDTALTGSNTLTARDYAISHALVNDGTLTVSGHILADNLTLNKTDATRIDIAGTSGTDGFVRSASYEVQLVNGGTVVNDNATVTHKGLPSGLTAVLNGNGTATAGGTVDYSEYLLTRGEAAVSDIHGIQGAAAAAITQTGGTLTVDTDAAVNGTGGSILLRDGTLSGTVCDATITADGGRITAQLAGTATVTVTGNTVDMDGQQLGNGRALLFDGGSVKGDLITSAGASIRAQQDALIDGSLALNGGTLNLQGHMLTVTDTLCLHNETALDVTDYHIGTHDLLSFGEWDGDLDNFRIDSSRFRYTLSRQEHSLVLTVKALNNTLTWNQPKGEWSTDGSCGNGIFRQDDVVVFDSAAAVSISGAVRPDSILVDSAAKVTLTGNKKVPGSGIAGEGSLVKNGAGLLTLNAGNSYTGGTVLKAGTIKATAADSFGSGVITVKGGTLDLASKPVTNDIILSGAATLKGDAKYAGNVTVDGKATLLAKTSYKGTTTIGEDSSLTLGAAATMAGSLTLNGGRLNIISPKGLTVAKGATVRLNDGSVDGLLTVGAGSTLQWYGGTIASPVLKGGTLDLGGKNSLTLTGVKAQVQFGDKVIDLPGKGIVRSDETLDVLSGTVKLTMGKETTDAAITVSGNAALVNGATHSGDITVDGTLAKGTTIKLINSHQTVNMNGAGITAAAISGIGTVNVNLNAGESLDATAAKLTAANIHLNGGTFINTKGIKLVKGQTLTLNGASVNLGAKGILTTAAGSTLKVSESATLSGSLTLGGGDLVFEGAALTVKGTLTLSKPVSVTGSGTLICDSVKPFKGDLGTLFGGAVVEQDGNTLHITNASPKTLSLDATPALPTLPEMPATNPVADAIAQADWGILDASRAFTGAVATRHQHAALLDKGRGAAWVSAFGASVRHGNQGAHHGSDGNIEGAALGMEHSVSETGVLGLAVGRSKNRIGATGVTHLRQETAHVAIYGQKQFKHNLTADATAAWGDTETKLGGSSWQQKSAALSGRLTQAHMVNDATAVRTFGGLSYEATESGSFGADSRSGSVQNLRAEVGAGATHAAGKAHVYGEASLTGDLIRHNPSVEMGGLRHHGATPGRLGVKGTFGAFYSFTDTWTGTASYSIEAESRATSHTLNVGVSKPF